MKTGGHREALFMSGSTRTGGRAALIRRVLLPALWSAGALLAVLSTGAQAQPRPYWGGDIGHFREHDWDLWRGGRWIHDRHGGRWGWWWVVGGVWYSYPSPVYPYPNPYEPPPSVVVTPSAAAPPPPTPQNWYYCDASKGYYPYVPTCASGWRSVPATPGGPPAAPAQ
jgi:hypothetical protein